MAKGDTIEELVSSDVIDSRDIIERIDDLEARDDLDEYETVELADLLAFAAEAEGYISDWKYGESLIRDSYFVEYAQELADDIGAVSKDASWPNSYIDWDAAAEALQQDFTSIELRGVTFWAR